MQTPADIRSDAGAEQGIATTNTDYRVEIHFPGADASEKIVLDVDDRALYPSVKRWKYIIANRRRMTDVTRNSLSHEIFELLGGFGASTDTNFPEQVQRMAAAGIADVAIPWERESIGWAARQFPWESALGLLTRPYRDSKSTFSVVRHLTVQEAFPAHKSVTSALIVRSGPGQIGKQYHLEHESS